MAAHPTPHRGLGCRLKTPNSGLLRIFISGVQCPDGSLNIRHFSWNVLFNDLKIGSAAILKTERTLGETSDESQRNTTIAENDTKLVRVFRKQHAHGDEIFCSSKIAFAPCSCWLTNSLPVGCIFPQTRCRSCPLQILETFRHLSTRTVFHRVQRLPKELLFQFLADHRFLRQAFRQDYLLTRFLVLHFVSLGHQYGRMVTVYPTTWLIAISTLRCLCSVHHMHRFPISR